MFRLSWEEYRALRSQNVILYLAQRLAAEIFVKTGVLALGHPILRTISTMGCNMAEW